MKFKVTQECNWVMGYLRCGHFEGVVEAKDEAELKRLIESGDIIDYMTLKVDDYSIEDCDMGNNAVEYYPIEESRDEN